MKTVLRAALATRELHSTGRHGETARRRAIAITPRRGAALSLRARSAASRRESQPLATG